jgi:glycosyltransferase involved in cell wall biosynthesis
MSYEPTQATHIVFAPPRWIDEVCYRGVVATDIAGSVRDQMNRDLWAVLLFLHGPTIPSPSREIDLYLTSATFAEKCPDPQLHLTARNFVDERAFYPLHIDREYDVVFNATWMSFKRHELLIEALKFSRDQGRPLRCLWFGYHWCTGWEQRETELKHAVRKLGLGVDFLPTDFDVREINRRYNLCRCAVICSSMEAGPRVMGEALLADIPYITTRDTFGGSPELVVPACGLCCEPSGEGIAKAIWQVCDDPNSFTPRAWALQHLCASAALLELGTSLEALERRKGWHINRGELSFPGFDWQGKLGTVRQAEECLAR